MRTTPLFTLSAVALCLSSTVYAESAEFRQHSAHQHGLVEWVIAQDGNDLLVEIAAPGSDVVGFEHAPKNDEQTTALNSALIALADANALFAVNIGANCSLEEKNISHTLAASKEDDHDDHGHDDHKGHDHHDHDDHEGEDGHGEFNVQYTFHCDNPENLKSVSTNWFKAFPQTEQIKIQSLTDSGVIAADMTASSNTFKF